MICHKVLILDDDRLDREHIKRLLSKQETEGLVEIYEASTPQEFLSIIKNVIIDCLIIDQNLPQMGGLQLCSKIRMQKWGAFTPIIMVTGEGDEALAVKAIKHGICNYLPKKNMASTNLYSLITQAIEEKNIMRKDREKIEDLELFIDTVTHDVTSPLRNILYVLDNMENTNKDAPHTEYADKVQDLKNSATSIVSLMESLQQACILGRENPNICVDLNEVVKLTLNNLAPIIFDTGAEIIVEEKLPIISGSYEMLLQLFQNLLSNALKFTRSGINPVIRIFTKFENGIVTIHIEDNGIGMTESDITNIFDNFTRGQNTENIQGTGLGLSLCRKIVSQLNGKITVVSKKGIGSTFCISLPFHA